MLADVCRVLEIANPRDAASRLDDEKVVVSTDTPGGVQEMTVVNASGLWSLVLTSRKAVAKRFKKWVMADVLPTCPFATTPAAPCAAAAPRRRREWLARR